MFVFAMVAIAITLTGLFIIGDEGSFAGLTSDEIATIAAMTLIASLVASSVMLTRERLSTRLKQAGVWIVILIGLVFTYEYRFELQNSTLRVLSGIIPSTAMTSVDSSGNTTVSIRRIGNHFETYGEINETQHSFLIDTGASTIVLSYDTAKAIMLNPERLAFNIPVATANGITQAARTRIDTIEIGGIKRNNLAVMIAADGALNNNLLGMNFLNTLSGYEVRGDRLILRD